MGILDALKQDVAKVENKIEEVVSQAPVAPQAPKEEVKPEVPTEPEIPVVADRSAYNCQTCNGEGLVRQELCPNCKGTGKVN